MQGSQSERRVHHRVSFGQRIQCTSAGSVFEARLADIGEGGVRLSDCQLRQREKLKVFVPIPRLGGSRAGMALFEGHVVWAAEGAAGVRFDHPPIEGRKLLKRFAFERWLAETER